MYPFPLLRNHKTCKIVDALMIQLCELLEAGNFRDIRNHRLETIVRLKDGTRVQVWTANKFYAYAQSGQWGELFRWDDEMPSRATVRRMDKAITKAFSYKIELALGGFD